MHPFFFEIKKKKGRKERGGGKKKEGCCRQGETSRQGHKRPPLRKSFTKQKNNIEDLKSRKGGKGLGVLWVACNLDNVGRDRRRKMS